MPVDFARESTLRSLSPLYAPLASESSVALIADRVEEIKEALSVGDLQTQLYEYGENVAVPSGVETSVLSYTVPVGKTLWIRSWSGWGDVGGEWFLRIDGNQKDGYRTNPAHLVAERDHGAIPIVALAGEIVTIKVKRTTNALNMTFRAFLGGVLNG